MKHQLVSVDYWAMLKSMVMYGVLTVLGWMMLRLFNAVFSLPRRLRTQQENIQATLEEFQRRYPDLNITEEDIKNADKELAEWTKEIDEKLNKDPNDEPNENDNETVKEICDEPNETDNETVKEICNELNEADNETVKEMCDEPNETDNETVKEICEAPPAIEEDKKTI